MIITTLIILSMVSFFFHFATRKQPLHPDSGDFLYIPLFEKIGYTFSPSKVLSSSPPNLTGDHNIVGCKFFLRIFANIALILGGYVKSFRTFYSIYNLLTGLAIYALAYLIGSPFLGLIAASIYWLMSLSPYLDSFQLHSEQYAFLPILLALIVIMLASDHDFLQALIAGRYLLLLVGGLLLGMVIFSLKISFVVETFAILCLSIFWGLGILDLILVMGGIVLFIFILAIYTYINTKSLDLLMFNILPSYNLYYRKSMPSDFNIDGGIAKYNLKTYFIIFSCFFLGSYYFVVGIALSVINHNTSIIAISFLPLASLVSIWYQRKFYMAHFYSVLPFSSIVAAYGVKQMCGLAGISFAINVSISIILLIPALVQIFQYYVKFDALTFHIKRSQIIRHKKTLNFIGEEGIAEYVKHNTAKDDFVLQWGYNHEFYVLAQRRAALSNYLLVTLLTDPLLNDSFIPNWRKNVLSDIERFIPKYIIDFDGSLNIKIVNEVSGHYYELERNFYGIFPLYRLVNTRYCEKQMPKEEILQSLTENKNARNINNKFFKSNSDYIQFVNRLVMLGSIKEADIYAEGGITKMFDDWRRINNEKRLVHGVSQ